MKKLIGNQICVYLKTVSDNIYGLLVDVCEDNLYLQGRENDPQVYIIPLSNINYCTTAAMPISSSSESSLVSYEPREQLMEKQEDSEITVYIDDDHVTDIPVPPTFDLSKWHDDIIKVVMGDPAVKATLQNKIQKHIEYYPGEVYIVTDSDPRTTKMPSPNNSSNVFTVDGSPAQSFLNPSQMVTRLQNSSRRKDGSKT